MPKPNRKLTNTVLYLLRGCAARPGVTQLLKMLWFADYWHYRQHLRVITGAEYVALERGPVLDNYKSVLEGLVTTNLLSKKEVAVEGQELPKIEYQREVEPDESVFSESEIAVLEQVIADCGPMTGLALSHRTHREGPWLFAWDPQNVGRKIPPALFRWMDNLPDEEELAIAKRSVLRTYRQVEQFA